MKRIIKGKTVRVGDNIDTDVIIPARFLITTEETELGKNVFFNLNKKFEKGDILIAGKNFGCGSSREHAPMAIKGRGIQLVIARSFARIFYRNSINIGLPILELKEVDKIKEGEFIEVDLSKGIIRTKSKIFKAAPFPEFMQKIIDSGGLIKYLKKNRRR